MLAADQLPELGTGLITVLATLGLTHVPVNRYEALDLGFLEMMNPLISMESINNK